MSIYCTMIPPSVGGDNGLELSSAVTNIEWTTDIGNAQPGRLVIETIDDGIIAPKEGWKTTLRIDDNPIFVGRLFTKEKSGDNNHWTLTSYDQLRYLKNQDTKVWPVHRAGDIFSTICRENQLNYGIVDYGNYICTDYIADSKSYFSMVERAMDLTLINAGQWLAMIDDYGTLKLLDIARLKSNLLIGDGSLATDFSYKSSIDEDVYNQIKLTKDNTETNKREVYIVNDSNKIAAWGKLQYHEAVNEKLNEAQITERAMLLIKAKSDPVRSFTVPCQGVIGVRAGTGVYINFSDLQSEGLGRLQQALVTKCVHKWEGEKHTMDLTLRVVDY